MKRQPKKSAPGGAGAATMQRAEESFSSPAESHALLPDFLRAITDNLGEGIYTLDVDGRVTFMNPAAERMLGWSESDLRGKEMHEIIHFQHGDGSPFNREQCPLVRVIRTGRVERIEDDAFTRRDGSMFPVSYVSAPIWTDGQLAGAVLAFHDITEHKALDEALRRSERDAAARAGQLLAIFESIADAVLVFDRDGRIMQINAADAELFADNWRVEGSTLAERDSHFTFLDGDRRTMTRERMPTVRVLRGETLRGESAVDLIVRTEEGREFVINATGAPVRDTSGAIVGGVLIGRDVTQRRRLEQQTREALTALMAMAQALVADVAESAESADPAPLGGPHVARRLAELTRALMVCDRVSIVAIEQDSGLMRHVTVAGLTAEQEPLWLANWPKAGRMSDFLPPALVERLNAGEAIPIDRTQPPFNHWANPFQSRTLLVIPMRVGERLLGNLTLDFGAASRQPRADEFAMAGAIAQLAAQIIERERLARDRATARAAALALGETTRRMDEFLSIAAHELKTPVSNSQLAVGLAIDTLRASVGPARDTRDPVVSALLPILALLERAGSHLGRLSQLVVDLLDVSRIRAGKLDLRLTVCDLAAIVREAVEEQRRLAPGRVIQLQAPAASGPPTLVLGDADRLRQVLSNFLTNALSYSPDERRVNVRLRTEGGWARLSVRDQGPGIPAAERRRVWERFYRAPGTPTHHGAGVGLGLGLHISRTIIEQHHGRVGLRGARGGGAIFWFALQALDETPPLGAAN